MIFWLLISWLIKSLKNQTGHSTEALKRGAGAVLAPPAATRGHWGPVKALPPTPEPSGSPHLPPLVPAGSPGSQCRRLGQNAFGQVGMNPTLCAFVRRCQSCKSSLTEGLRLCEQILPLGSAREDNSYIYRASGTVKNVE